MLCWAHSRRGRLWTVSSPILVNDRLLKGEQEKSGRPKMYSVDPSKQWISSFRGYRAIPFLIYRARFFTSRRVIEARIEMQISFLLVDSTKDAKNIKRSIISILKTCGLACNPFSFSVKKGFSPSFQWWKFRKSFINATSLVLVERHMKHAGESERKKKKQLLPTEQPNIWRR